jgi:hypothetical protein
MIPAYVFVAFPTYSQMREVGGYLVLNSFCVCILSLFLPDRMLAWERWLPMWCARPFDGVRCQRFAE